MTYLCFFVSPCSFCQNIRNVQPQLPQNPEQTKKKSTIKKKDKEQARRNKEPPSPASPSSPPSHLLRLLSCAHYTSSTFSLLSSCRLVLFVLLPVSYCYPAGAFQLPYAVRSFLSLVFSPSILSFFLWYAKPTSLARDQPPLRGFLFLVCFCCISVFCVLCVLFIPTFDRSTPFRLSAFPAFPPLPRSPSFSRRHGSANRHSAALSHLAQKFVRPPIDRKREKKKGQTTKPGTACRRPCERAEELRHTARRRSTQHQAQAPFHLKPKPIPAHAHATHMHHLSTYTYGVHICTLALLDAAGMNTLGFPS